MTYVPKCDQCGRFTTAPEVFIPHPVPGMDVEFRLCPSCQDGDRGCGA